MKKKSTPQRPARRQSERATSYKPSAPTAPTAAGLPSRVEPEDRLLLRGSGLWLVHAAGSEVREYKLRRHGDDVEAELFSTITLGARVTALADSRYGVVIASSNGSGSDLHRIVEGCAHHVAHVDGVIESMASLGTSVFAATSAPNRLDGKLIEVDLYRRAIASERPLASSRVELSADPTGSHLGVTDRSNGSFQIISRGADPCGAGGPGTSASSPVVSQGPPQGHPIDCCCCKESDSPPPSDGTTGPGTQGQTPGQGGEPCHPGESGLPTSDGGAVVGKGGRLGRHPNEGGGQPDPCTADLMWSARTLAHAASVYVAADERGRNFAIVSALDMRILDQRQLGRAGGIILADPASPMVLLLHKATGLWEVIHTDRFSSLLVGLDHFPSATAPDSVQFQGMQTMSLITGHASGTGTVKVLILPVIEAGQTFNNPDLPKFAAYMERTAFSHVRDYYFENSFGRLKDIQYQIYGLNTGPNGGPLSLPRLVKDYYYPPYDPARIDLTKSGLTFPYTLVFDGRESLKIHVQPTSGRRVGTDLTLNFPALLVAKKQDQFPAQVSFSGTETVSMSVKLSSGTSKSLTLKFPAKTVNINAEVDIPSAFTDLGNYLDGVFAAAESAAKITPRLFAHPKLRRVKQEDAQFGYLAVIVNAADTSGARMDITSMTASAGLDPLGFQSGMRGHIALDGSSLGDATLQAYVNWADILAQEDAGFDYTQRYLADGPTASTNKAAGTLVVKFAISDNEGGPGATVTLASSTQLGALFDTATAVPNSASTFHNSNAPRELQALINDAFTAAVFRQSPPGSPRDKNVEDTINKYFAQFNMIAIGQIGVAINDPADPNSVQPAEMWSASPPNRPNELRAVDWLQTGHFAEDNKIQFQVMWNFLFFDSKPDFSVMCHELGHAIGFRDLYLDANFRLDLAYLGSWSIMDDNSSLAHHIAYHKWQAGWIDNITTIPPAAPGAKTSTEVLLVPVEYWENSLLSSAPVQFGTGSDVKVVQMVQLDLGGDGAVVDLIEARQKGVHFSQKLDKTPAILITNTLQPWDDTRYAFEGKYRREAHLLNPNNILQNPGDRFDLAKAAEFSAKGIVVEVVDRKQIDNIEVFRIKITRENTAFIDLYFSSADPYYMNPDLWVDWAGNNGPGGGSSTNPDDHHKYPLGQPRDQGEQVNVPNKGSELHWIVARIRNRGQVQAEEVKLNFQMCVPPGGGDKSKNFQLITSVTAPVVAGGDVPLDVVARWDVPAGFGGHNCLLVDVADYKIPKDSDGAALASDDVWQANNWAQKNVDQYVPVPGSPYEPIEFDFSVNNAGLYPEVAYLEPDNLPYGMALTVTPSRRSIPPRTTVLFRCKLQLDENIIDAGCRNDREFKIVVWRVEGDTTVKWGGVQYKVRPRNKSATKLSGFWNQDNTIQLNGSVSPDPGGGIAHVRLAFDGLAAAWQTAPIMPGGAFVLNTAAPAASRTLDSVALYEGSTLLAPSRSAPLTISPPGKIA